MKNATTKLPELGERFEVREETRFCVYRVGADEPIGVSKTKADADECRRLCELNEWPWYSRLSDPTAPNRNAQAPSATGDAWSPIEGTRAMDGFLDGTEGDTP